MSLTRSKDARIRWQWCGKAELPPLVLLHSIGSSIGMWAMVVPFLAVHFRLLLIDTRGHGQSDAPDYDYTLELLASDVVAVLDAAGLAQAAIAGVSLGGMIAMELAIRYPDRIAALVPICTSAAMDREAWSTRVDTVRQKGMKAIADLAMARFLSPGFVARYPDVAAQVRGDLLATPAAGYAGAGAAIRDMTLVQRLSDIDVPTLVIAGDLDISAPFVGHGEHIVAAVPGAKVCHVGTGHLAPVEAPEVIAATIAGFLAGTQRRWPYPLKTGTD